MKKNLAELLEHVTVQNIEDFGKDSKSCLIRGLEFDSRAIKQDYLFFALPGVHVHGNDYIIKAIENGAVAVLHEGSLPEAALQKAKESGVILVQVESTRFAMAPIADAFYDSPSAKLVTIGVTGTEGKSTTVSFVWQLLRLAGYKTGFISTVDYSLGGESEANPEHQTTPEAPIIQQKLHTMLQNGCEFAVVESSSHGLSTKTNRLGNMLFDGAAFMNVTHEHLEFHGTHEQYRDDKANLFRKLDEHNHAKTLLGKQVNVPAVGAVSLDDVAADYFARATKHEVIGFTMKEAVEVPESIQRFLQAKDIQGDEKGVSFSLCECANSAEGSGQKQTTLTDEYAVRIETPGTFNVYNAMAAIILVARLTGRTIKDIAQFASGLTPIKGRMTAIDCGQNFEVIVDYAHTPSSFETIFPPLKKRAKGKIISIFGSGGERDIKKRPIQGRIAAEYSDIVILSDEDPRGEDPMELLEMIAAGCTNLEREKSLFLIPDRPQAIRKAFSIAKENDIVLLLGKGHENSIIYKDFTMPYDEISEAKKALGEMR